MEVVGFVVVVQEDDDRPWTYCGQRTSRTRVDRAEPRVGDEDDEVGFDRGAHVGAVAVERNRRAHPADGFEPLRRARGRPAQLNDQVSTVNMPRSSTAAAIGGAMAAGYQRWARHTSFGCSPAAVASTSASVGPVSSGSNDCTGLRAETVRPCALSVDSTAAPTHVLPISVPVPVQTTRVTSRGWPSPIDRPRRRCARRTARCEGARCPGRRSAVGWREPTGRGRRAVGSTRRAPAARRRARSARSVTDGRERCVRRGFASRPRAPPLRGRDRSAQARWRPRCPQGSAPS